MVEKRDQAGGCAYTYRRDGLTFEGGPTIITALWLIDELFVHAGRMSRGYVRLLPINPFYNIRFEDGSTFRYNGNRADFIARIRAWSPGDVDAQSAGEGARSCVSGYRRVGLRLRIRY